MRKYFILKRILLSFILSIVCYSINAQSLTFTQAMDSLLAPLDKNRITTGILYERVKPLANIDLFNIPSSDPFVSENSYFRQAYLELYNATYNSSGWLKPKELRDWSDAQNLERKYNVGVLDYQFNMIDSNAVQNGLLTFSNGQFHDVVGAASPFYTRHLQVASILTDEIPNGTVTLRYNSNFFKTNQSVQISSIILNFGTIGTYTLTPSNPYVLVNFPGSGVINFNITVQYTNGSSFSNTSEIQVGSNSSSYSKVAEDAPPPNDSLWISGKYPFQGYEETQAFYGKAKISIWWKLDANEIPVPGMQKPIIIVDGFDPLDTRLNRGIYDLLVYIDGNGEQQNFAKELRKAGFDIIVMDMPAYSQTFPAEGTYNDPSNSLAYPNILPAAANGIVYGGGDYIQRNAYTLEYLIDYVKLKLQQNNSTEKIVVVGPSMGGQITRFALRDMEIRGQNHNCKLWVSFDSPHEGAYVPLGLQYSISELAATSNSEGAIRVRDLWINCPAAQQMTLHQYKSNSEPVAGVSNFFYPYYNEINNPSFGFPQAVGLRKIAMLNGSDLGVSQTVGTACQLATKFKVTFKPRGFLGVVTLLFASHYSLIAFALSPLQNHKTYLAPASGECTIFKFDKDLGGDFTKKAIAPSWSNTSLDLIQGGFLPSFKIYKEQTEGQRPKKWYKDLLTTKVDDYVTNGAHELTYSTLAVGLGNLPDPTRKWDANFRLDKFNQPVDVTCPETQESPFEMYWAPDINTRHDSLLLGHVVRLRREIIEGLAWQKTQIQRQGTIQASKNYLCNGETATFSLTQPLTGMSYNWTTPNSYLQIISGQGTSSVTIQNNGSPSGFYSISCQASSACYLVNANFTIHAGVYGSSDYPITGPSQSYCGYSMYFSAPDLPGATNYNWFWPSNWNYINGQGTRFLTVQTPSSGSYLSGMVGVRVDNICGSGGSPALKYVQITCGGWRFYVSPNPTNGDIVVSTTDDKKQSVKGINQVRIYQIKIIDQLGNVKKQFHYPGGISNANVNTSSLAAGVYVIHAYNGKSWEASKFIKQ